MFQYFHYDVSNIISVLYSFIKTQVSQFSNLIAQLITFLISWAIKFDSYSLEQRTVWVFDPLMN